MMDCDAYRRAMMADPQDPDAGLREHRESCRDCQQFTERLLRFESRLERALRVDLPARTDTVAQVLPLRAKYSPRAGRGLKRSKRWFAMAASVLLAVAVAAALWLGAPGPSLAADVVTHMGGEPEAWRRTDLPVPGVELQDVLRDSHLRLGNGADLVSYAQSCGFRGHHVPHLVIQTESGPVTVMVLVHESVPKTVRFDEQGYRGVIVPVAGHGSLAVLTHGPDTDLKTIEHIAARVQASIVWTR
jgi:Protein of unknown function (DUF3379)